MSDLEDTIFPPSLPPTLLEGIHHKVAFILFFPNEMGSMFDMCIYICEESILGGQSHARPPDCLPAPDNQ